MENTFEYEDPWQHRLLNRGALGAFDPATETILLPSNLDFNRLTDYNEQENVVLGHELSHHLVLIGTLYGASLRALFSIRFELLRKFYVALYECDKLTEIKVPLSKWLHKLKSSQNPKFKEAIIEFEKSVDIVRLINSLEGFGTYSLDAIAKPLSTYTNYLPGLKSTMSVSLTDLLRSSQSEEIRELGLGVKSCPQIKGNNIGGTQLLECVAWITEVIHRGGHVENPRSDTKFMIDNLEISYQYQVAFAYYLVTSLDDKEEIVTIFNTPTVHGVKHILRFLAIVHLSLMVPLHPGFQTFIGKVDSWFDIHPGWRFVKICNKLKNIPNVLPDLSNFEQVQDKICSFFNWPQPKNYREYSNALLSKMPKTEESSINELKRTLDIISTSEKFPWLTVFTPSYYPDIDDSFKQVLQQVTNKYNPTMIQDNLGVIPGSTNSFDKVFLQMFLKNRAAFMPKMPSNTALLLAEYSLMNYLIHGWFDFIIKNSEKKLDSFLAQMFPLTKLEKGMLVYLKDLLEIGCLIYSFCRLSDFNSLKK
ncbi:MAG: hypothetical protein MI922_12665 [Bacteroidales bacterium]|nr:hypothetical protein [Bacteroidales bacterium]